MLDQLGKLMMSQEAQYLAKMQGSTHMEDVIPLSESLLKGEAPSAAKAAEYMQKIHEDPFLKEQTEKQGIDAAYLIKNTTRSHEITQRLLHTLLECHNDEPITYVQLTQVVAGFVDHIAYDASKKMRKILDKMGEDAVKDPMRLLGTVTDEELVEARKMLEVFVCLSSVSLRAGISNSSMGPYTKSAIQVSDALLTTIETLKEK